MTTDEDDMNWEIYEEADEALDQGVLVPVNRRNATKIYALRPQNPEEVKELADMNERNLNGDTLLDEESSILEGVEAEAEVYDPSKGEYREPSEMEAEVLEEEYGISLAF